MVDVFLGYYFGNITTIGGLMTIHLRLKDQLICKMWLVNLHLQVSYFSRDLYIKSIYIHMDNSNCSVKKVYILIGYKHYSTRAI